jgi:hypothetical protein
MFTARLNAWRSIQQIGESMIHSPLEIKHQLYGYSPPSRLLKNSENGPKHHNGQDEVQVRHPVTYCYL